MKLQKRLDRSSNPLAVSAVTIQPDMNSSKETFRTVSEVRHREHAVLFQRGEDRQRFSSSALHVLENRTICLMVEPHIGLEASLQAWHRFHGYAIRGGPSDCGWRYWAGLDDATRPEIRD